jgi:hypothetical protein
LGEGGGGGSQKNEANQSVESHCGEPFCVKGVARKIPVFGFSFNPDASGDDATRGRDIWCPMNEGVANIYHYTLLGQPTLGAAVQLYYHGLAPAA